MYNKKNILYERRVKKMSVLEALKNKEETVWLNPDREKIEPHQTINGYSYVYLKAAQQRFMRFLPFIAEAFPETAAKKGVIESNLVPIPAMKEWLNSRGANIQGNVFVKDDAHLPVAGSVKARGGIHEVLKIAEEIAYKEEMLTPGEKFTVFNTPAFREMFSKYTIQVGSTGNLGLSIGRTAAKMGFKVIVHMSSDAKEWKKALLRSEGVTVKEYAGDYSQAVATGRAESEADSMSIFVDDENSKDLFFGYSTAALRLKVQLGKIDVTVDEKHPLFVYLPCGVGGAPGGITYGLKEVFGDAVHCFFAEPVNSPCFLLGMASGKYQNISVQDIGISGETVADGLAVPRVSGFVCEMMKPLAAGAYTLKEERFEEYQKALLEKENLFFEPSACAGFLGLEQIQQSGTAYETYLEEEGLKDLMQDAVHVVWGTGGGLMEQYGKTE